MSPSYKMHDKFGPQFYLVDFEDDLNKPLNSLKENDAQFHSNSNLVDKYRLKSMSSVKIIELDNNNRSESNDGAMEI